jgi:FAD-dependent oxidoreductase family protein
VSERTADILIVGGGTGGVAAALAALRMGRSVIVTEETDWIGGQLTSQAVPPDEHPWIESDGATNSYRQLREAVRAYYRRHYPLTSEARRTVHLNPGNGLVSGLCHEPRVALAVLEAMLAPYWSTGLLQVVLRTRPIAAETDGDRIVSVTVRSSETGHETVITAPYVLDATELGDLLALADVEHVTGAESQAQTGELHAVEGEPQPLDQQAVSWCFALDWLPDRDNTIEKPEGYEFWHTYQADFWPGPQFGWDVVDPRTREPFCWPLLADGWTDLWRFRRILWRDHLADEAVRSDITLVNWPQIDYWIGPLVGVPEEESRRHYEGARQLSLSFLYWMQTEAPRHDGGSGYPELRLRADVVGTEDGLAKQVYVRESRRIKAEFTVLEEHVGVEQRAGLVGAERFHDTVGTGCYKIDLHPSTGQRTYIDISAYPFQLPLGALIPIRMENLLPACKNLGVTHITNGCYRLHPVEWNIGEAAGALAAHCLSNQLTPRQVRNTASHLTEFQRMLHGDLGFALEWPEYARVIGV